MTGRILVFALVLAVLAGCSVDDIDLRATMADLAAGACRSVGSCSVTCADGSTLDGRPAAARCRR